VTAIIKVSGKHWIWGIRSSVSPSGVQTIWNLI